MIGGDSVDPSFCIDLDCGSYRDERASREADVSRDRNE